MTHTRMHVTLPVRHLSTSATSRTITGDIVTYTEVGLASNGPTIFTAGSLVLPADIDAVKLLVQHDSFSAAVGYMIAYEDGTGKATASFYLPTDPDGNADAALREAGDGTRDGLSVGVMITDYEYADDGDTIVVKAAELREVSLVTIPAFKSARVTSVTAAQSAPRKESTTMDRVQLQAALAAGTITQEDYDRQIAALPTDAPVPPTPPVAATTPADPAVPAPTAEQFAAFAQAMATFQAQGPQIVPPARTADRPLRSLAAEFAAGFKAGRSPFELTAALNDIIPANDGGQGFITRPQWVDEVWQASRAARPFIDAAGAARPITGLKVQGWKFDLENMPTIDPYDGNKTAIPTSQIKTVPAEADVVRRAGGWDFDRAYVDLGNGEFVDATLTEATNDYKRKSETYVREALVAAATTVVGGTTFASNLARLGAAAVALGASLTTVAMSTDLWLAFAELTEADVPWWLRNQGELNLGTTSGTAGSLSFNADPDLDAGTILAVDGRAYTFYEKAPIQAQALNIPNGGVDLGVFSYLSVMINDPRAVLKISTGAPAGGGE